MKKSQSKIKKAYLSLQPLGPTLKKKVVQKKSSKPSSSLIQKTSMHKVGKSLAVTAMGTELTGSRVMTGQRSNVGSTGVAAGAGTTNGSMCGAQL